MNKSMSKLADMLSEEGIGYKLLIDGMHFSDGDKNYKVWAYDENNLVMSICYLSAEDAFGILTRSGSATLREYEHTGIEVCSGCGAMQPDDHVVYYCWCCGKKIEQTR